MYNSNQLKQKRLTSYIGYPAISLGSGSAQSFPSWKNNLIALQVLPRSLAKLPTTFAHIQAGMTCIRPRMSDSALIKPCLYVGEDW